VIAVHGGLVAHLGGWRGDRLSLSRDAGPFAPIADLGWHAATQTTPQRRVLVTDDALLVVEPVAGPVLLPPLRVRRFDLEGREVGREEGPGEEGPAALYFHLLRDGDAIRLRRTGIDPSSGRPTVFDGTLDADVCRVRRDCSGTPLHHDGAWWYPVRMEALVRADAARGVEAWPGEPGPVAAVHGRAVCAGMRDGAPGVWIDGEWRPLAGGRLFDEWQAPRDGTVAPSDDGGIAILRREGGPLPVLDGAPVGLPPGPRYDALVRLPQGLFGLAGDGGPRLVAAAAL